ncbi:unnamed protein product [marine sediment metagenome]|uniref:Uncharacterized protein n=1 Tax=marine sediment metagenome TaxID=412755 RepID=X1BM23_9ZZZZ
MACNIATQRRRKKWQNFNPENSPCHCDFGFAIAGCVARQWWVRWDTAQVAPQWLWLNAGFVCSFLKIDSGRCIYHAAPTGLTAVDFSMIGSNTPVDHPGFGTITVNAELRVTIDTTGGLGIGTFTDRAGTGLFQPEPTATFDFSQFITIVPVPGFPSLIVGQAFVTPLMPYTNCT